MKMQTIQYELNDKCRSCGNTSNLISNNVYSTEATNIIDEGELANIVVKEMIFPWKHPVAIYPILNLDKRFFKKFLDVSISYNIKNKLLKLNFKELIKFFN
jgi:hypothetical protein